MTLKVGITGGIGSGKSIICKVFNILGAPVFNSDLSAKEIMNNSNFVRSKLTNLFGDDIYLKSGNIDRKKIAEIIFNDKIALQSVNKIVHPEVRKAFVSWAEKQKVAYVLQESAILFENNLNDFYDKIIVVTADDELRIKRTISRNGMERDQVIERMKNQQPQSVKASHADYVIKNNGSDLVIPRVIEIDKNLKEEWQNLVNG